MGTNGARMLSPAKIRPSKGDKVCDRTGKTFIVQQLGMKYLLVSLPGGDPKATLMLKTSDVYVQGPNGSMNE